MKTVVTRRRFATTLGLAGAAAATATAGSAAAARTGALFAGDFGVVGDGRTDDTRAAQAFLDHCRTVGAGIASFGGMVVAISGPLLARDVGIVFDAATVGGAATGFRASGAGYTAVTVTGQITDFCAAVTGGGAVAVAGDGTITRDTRPRIDGFQFGSTAEDAPLLLSTVRYARVSKLSGIGIRHVRCWDSTFMGLSVEECGNAASWAFEVLAAGRESCSECVWTRLQVEHAAVRAIHVHDGTLSCAFTKIHSERAAGGPSSPAWIFAGVCDYGAVRLHGSNALALFRGSQGVCRQLRAEGVAVQVDATGGSYSFTSPAASSMAPAANQNGRVLVSGGAIQALVVGAGWHLNDCAVDRLVAGFMPPGGAARLTACRIGVLIPGDRETTGQLDLDGCVVASARLASATGRIRRLSLRNGSDVAVAAPIGDQLVTVDAESTLRGTVTVDGGVLRLAGRLIGDLRIVGACHSTAGHDAFVTGTVVGWGPPTPHPLLGPLARGMTSKNLADPASIAGWTFTADAWHARRG